MINSPNAQNAACVCVKRSAHIQACIPYIRSHDTQAVLSTCIEDVHLEFVVVVVALFSLLLSCYSFDYFSCFKILFIIVLFWVLLKLSILYSFDLRISSRCKERTKWHGLTIHIKSRIVFNLGDDVSQQEKKCMLLTVHIWLGERAIVM